MLVEKVGTEYNLYDALKYGHRKSLDYDIDWNISICHKGNLYNLVCSYQNDWIDEEYFGKIIYIFNGTNEIIEWADMMNYICEDGLPIAEEIEKFEEKWDEDAYDKLEEEIKDYMQETFVGYFLDDIMKDVEKGKITI